jgi:DNA invertase Pin-like site-specific DNA recombinase
MPSFKSREREVEENIWSTQMPIDVNWGIYARQSTSAQVKNNVQSTEMQTGDLIQYLLDRRVEDDRIALFDADLGVSGTRRIDERTGLQELVERIKLGEIKAILVYQISRLFRDETGVQYNVFANICKEHNCILVTSDGMIFNFRNPMHLKMFRFLAEMAAEYIPQHIRLLNQARERKARKGLYAGMGSIPRGYIVDFTEGSKTYEKYVRYTRHSTVVFDLFLMFYDLDGDLSRMCRELEKRPYIFPYYEDSLDYRNKPKNKKNKRGKGGIHITRGGLICLLTNPVYIGWWIVCGNVISRNNHERIIDEEHEYLFWFAFDRLSPYTVDGEVNEERINRRVRYTQKKTERSDGLLKDRIVASDGDEIYVHRRGGGSRVCYLKKDTSRMIHLSEDEIPVSLIDSEFSAVFFEHLRGSHEFDHYRQFVDNAEGRIASASDDLQTQLDEILRLQEEITDEILATRRSITVQVRERCLADPDADPDMIKQQLELEAEPVIRSLRNRSAKLEEPKVALEQKIAARGAKHQRPAMPKASSYKDFQSELADLVQTWKSKNIQDKKDFINLFVETAILEFVSPHWVRLEISWTIPGWGDNMLYIFRPCGASPQWSDDEDAFIRLHYPIGGKEEILRQLPQRSWGSILHKAEKLDITRPRRKHNERCPVPNALTYLDYEFTQMMGIDPSSRNTIHIYPSAQNDKFDDMELVSSQSTNYINHS